MKLRCFVASSFSSTLTFLIEMNSIGAIGQLAFELSNAIRRISGTPFLY